MGLVTKDDAGEKEQIERGIVYLHEEGFPARTMTPTHKKKVSKKSWEKPNPY